jgi:DNA polymerase-3 subunit delta'
LLFKDVFGLEKQKQQLLQNLEQGRLAHAQLFLGNEGGGNLALALALVQRIYCTNPSENDACGVCSSCIKNQKFIHPDVHFSFPTINTNPSKPSCSDDYISEWRALLGETSYFNETEWLQKISSNENKQLKVTAKETQEILRKLSLKAYEGEAKTLIMWLPEHLRNESNKLLKIIEEPPQKTYFILVAYNYDSLLPTITSRTQLLKVPAYSPGEIQAFLTEKYHLEAERAENIGFLSDGSINEAIKLVESVENNYSDMFRDWMLACFKNDLYTVSALTEQIAKLGRNQIQIFLKNGLRILRESLMYSTVPNYEIRFEENAKNFIMKFSSTLNAHYIERSYEQINNVVYHIMRNANAKISLFNLSLELRKNFIRKR